MNVDIHFQNRSVVRKLMLIDLEQRGIAWRDLTDDDIRTMAAKYADSRSGDELRGDLVRTAMCYYDTLRSWDRAEFCQAAES